MTSPDFDWFRARLVAAATGLLSEEDQERFDAMRAGNADCARAYEEVVAGAQERDAGHISPGLIARWDRARDTLRGLERDLVAAHLARCDTCSQDLVALGFAPTLDPAPGSEAAPPQPAAGAHAVVHIVQRAAGGARQAWNWVFGGWALAATAAALVLLLVRPGAPPPAPGTAPVSPAIEIPRATRSAAEAIAATLVPGQESVDIDFSAVYATELDPSRVSVRISVVSPGGDTMVDIPTSAAALIHGKVTVGDGVTPLEPGDYAVELVERRDGGTVTIHTLTIRLDAP